MENDWCSEECIRAKNIECLPSVLSVQKCAKEAYIDKSGTSQAAKVAIRWSIEVTVRGVNSQIQ